MAHEKVLKNPDQNGIWKMLVFEEGETEVPREKPFRARTRINNKLNPHDAESRNQTQVPLVRGEYSRHCAHHQCSRV